MNNTERISEYAKGIRRTLSCVWRCGASLRDYVYATGDGGYSDLAFEQALELVAILADIDAKASKISRLCDALDKESGS